MAASVPMRSHRTRHAEERRYTAMVIEDPHAAADMLVRATGDRVTAARVRVLAVLLAAKHALTHGEVEAALGASHGVNRVTLYRILEWLTRRQIAHKIAAEDRVWRFTVRREPHAGDHPHFVCNACGRVLCLSGPGALPKPRLPVGFRPQAFELTVKGLCDACGRHGAPKLVRNRRAKLAAPPDP
jgi:Fur family ferric uptake transcriptional regulator